MTDRDDDMLAAEFAIGTLDGPERSDVGRRRSVDTGFNALVTTWEQRLAPLSEAVRDVDPPARLWQAILARLAWPSDAAPDPALARTIVVLNGAVLRWRRATIVVSALAACLALAIAIDAFRAPAPRGSTLVAVLQKSEDAPAYLVHADLSEGNLSVRSLHAAAPADRSYELWIIDPAVGGPKSLGVLDKSVSEHALPAGLPADVLSRATYAVTEEQAGGSPTGKPTGSPIFVGHLVSTGP